MRFGCIIPCPTTPLAQPIGIIPLTGSIHLISLGSFIWYAVGCRSGCLVKSPFSISPVLGLFKSSLVSPSPLWCNCTLDYRSFPGTDCLQISIAFCFLVCYCMVVFFVCLFYCGSWCCYGFTTGFWESWSILAIWLGLLLFLSQCLGFDCVCVFFFVDLGVHELIVACLCRICFLWLSAFVPSWTKTLQAGLFYLEN